MKKIALFSLLAAAVMIVAPRPAYAGDKGLAILGGILGGLIIADALDGDSHHHTSDHVSSRDGYWRDVPYDVWIEGRWIVNSHHHRRYVAGHYETRVRKIWIAHHSRDRLYSNRHHRDDRRYSHRDRRHDNRRHDSRRYGNRDRNDRRGHR